jgi:hypothetical protein
MAAKNEGREGTKGEGNQNKKACLSSQALERAIRKTNSFGKSFSRGSGMEKM